jgi:pyruvate formate lyase activating enzyme
MLFGGLSRFTLSDYPGKVAAIAFTQGCNFCCPFCHNGSLLPKRVNPSGLIPQRDIVDFLQSRKGSVDALVISGGEPTLHKDLPYFMREVKDLGFLIKLDTNGSHPFMLRQLVANGLVDYIAMDIKAPVHAYRTLAGCDVDFVAIAESIICIAKSGIDHHFRTTFVDAKMSIEDVEMIQAMIPSGSAFKVQAFDASHARDPQWKTLNSSYTQDDLDRLFSPSLAM